MIDYIKLDVNADADALVKNPLLNFGAKINEQTGELIVNRYGYAKKVAQFGFMELIITTNIKTGYTKIELAGSLHKHAQAGTNYADFTHSDICKTIDSICGIICLPPDSFTIRHIEFGTNIKPTHSAENILSSLIAYKGKRFETREYNGSGYMKRFCFSQFDLKVYNKSKQYSLPYNLLRYEIKVFKMQYFARKNIELHTLSDLLRADLYKQLLETICHSIADLYWFDYRILVNDIINHKHRLVLTECINTEFWAKYRNAHSKKGYRKKLNRFNTLVKMYAPDCLKTYVENSITQKWFELLNSTHYLPLVLKPTVPIIYPHIVGKKEYP